MQVRDPVGHVGVGLSADDITDVGAGTVLLHHAMTIK